MILYQQAKPRNIRTVYVKTLIEWNHQEYNISVCNKRRDLQIWSRSHVQSADRRHSFFRCITNKHLVAISYSYRYRLNRRRHLAIVGQSVLVLCCSIEWVSDYCLAYRAIVGVLGNTKLAIILISVKKIYYRIAYSKCSNICQDHCVPNSNGKIVYF